MNCKSLLSALLLVIVLGTAGCASFEQGKVPQVESMPDVSDVQHKPTAYVDFKFYRGEPGNDPVKNNRAMHELQPLISQSIEKSALFSEHSFDPRDANVKNYTLRVNVYNHGNAGVAAASGFVSGLTFGVIPGAATDHFVVELKALDQQGNLLGQHDNADAVRTWIGIWFIPMMANTQIQAIENTVENQLLSALTELFNNNSLNYAAVVAQD